MKMSASFSPVVKKVAPTVVNVFTTKTVRNPMPDIVPFFDDPFFRRFFGSPFDDNGGRRQPRTFKERSLGSGVIVTGDGYILTNNHVVDGASEVRVKLSDGRDLKATVVGRDPKTDLALLKVDATHLPVIPMGDSSRLQVGEPVMAIGNPFGLEQTVTTGIVSATGRVIGEGPYDDFIQTDASINPGNSGGPLINSQGQVVGINTAIFSQSGGSVGIGFAIPAKLAESVVTQLAESGHVVRGWLGVAIQPVTPDLAKSFNLSAPTGALVSSVVDGSPAMGAGVKQGDIITEYDGRKVARADDLPKAVADTPVGRQVSLGIVRDGKPMTLKVAIAKLEDHEVAAATGSSAKPSLGVSVQALDPALTRQLGQKDTRGVVIREVRDGSPADAAGLRPGDVIAEVDHRQLTSAQDLQQALARHDKKAPLLMLVHRQDQSMYVAVTL
jgi:serine protease Do